MRLTNTLQHDTYTIKKHDGQHIYNHIPYTTHIWTVLIYRKLYYTSVLRIIRSAAHSYDNITDTGIFPLGSTLHGC
jgi:hypothetical protein